MKFFANMIETWFRRGFHSKCNSNIKLTLMRVEIIKRRRKAMEKYLRNDIADLLRNGFVADAYRRAGGLYLDQSRSSCYDFVEEFCKLILNQLTAMNEQSECPEECREAVPSLVYAAARIADLPELRELRSLFSERYGNSLEAFINQEFVSLLKPDHPTHDMKIQLMQEIALEHGLEWDPNSIEQNLHKPPPYDRSQSAYGNGNNGYSHSTPNGNGLRIKIQETRNREGSNGELEKQTDQVRKRILDYWSRTTSFFSTSRETSTSSEDSSSDDFSNGRSFFGYRTKQNNNSNKENQEVSNNPNIQILENDATSAPGGKDRRNRNGGPSPRVKSHSTECLPNPLVRKTRKGHVRAASDMPVNPPKGHVHPKLPDYDEIIARFTALREKS